MTSNAAHVFLDLFGAVAPVFVSGLWQGCILVAAVALCLRLLPGVVAGTRFTVWMTTFAFVALLPIVPSGLRSSEHAPNASMMHAGQLWALAIAVSWALMTAARATELAIEAVRLRGVWKRAERVSVDDGLLALLQRSSQPAVLCISSDVDSPGVIGFFRPRLLIPRALYTALTADQLRQVVLHECAHLRRRDDWMNLLQKTALVLFPLNPALFWVDRRLAFERELACDASVVASTAAPLQYARCLTELAQHRLTSRRLSLLLPAWSRQSELSLRVHGLLRPMQRVSPLRGRASGLLLCVCMAGAAIALARAPRLVSFDKGLSEGSYIPAICVASTRNIPPAASTGEWQEYAAVDSEPLVHAQVVSASMPQRKSTIGGHVSRAQQQRRFPVHAKHRVGSQLVLTSTVPSAGLLQTYSDRRSSWLPAVTLTEISTSYAAMPFGDGWLIVQL